MTDKPQILLVVHSDSLKGSAEFNLGLADAEDARKAVIAELGDWNGGVGVIMGEPESNRGRRAWKRLDDAIDSALIAARLRGDLSTKVDGPDMEDVDQVVAARQLLAKAGIRPGDAQVTVTGAWHHADLSSGCVTSVFLALQEDGHDVFVSSTAAELDPDPKIVKKRLAERYATEDIFRIRESKNEGALFPDGSAWAFCTNWARYIRHFEGEGTRLFGYAAEDNPTSHISTFADGHDFAVVDGRFICDPWISHVEGISARIVFDLEDPADAEEIARIYGDRACWSPNDGLDPIPARGAIEPALGA